MSESAKSGFITVAIIVGLLVAVIIANRNEGGSARESSAPAPTAAPPLALTMATQLAQAKGHRILYESRNAPRVILTDAAADHPWCNDRPTQIAKVGETLTCYRWQGDRVILRRDAGNWLVMQADAFKAR